MKSPAPEWQSPLFDASLFRFIWRLSGPHQVGAALISIVLFAVGAVPLELQRRIVNTATDGGPFNTIVLLASLYGLLALFEGLTKLGLNVYRNWIGESATRWLRHNLFDIATQPQTKIENVSEGVQLSIVIAEAQDIGGFVGDSMSLPLLQIGILATVTSYLVYLQPLMALVIAVVFLPQLVFVPLMQNAINRRVGQRTILMRQVSVSIVEAGGVYDRDGTQRSRIQTVFEINMGIYKIKFTMNFIMNLMIQLGYIGILAIGGYFVVTKQTEIGTVIAFLTGLGKINDPWGELVDWYRNLRVTQVKYEMVKRVMQIT